MMDASWLFAEPLLDPHVTLAKRRLRVREVEKGSSQVRWVEAHPLPWL